MTADSSRSTYWDVVKGIGITAVVWGHCMTRFGAFVYLFHLALFFFATGFFYNEKKYGDSPFAYFGTRLNGCWLRAAVYSALLVLLHNALVRQHLIVSDAIYNHSQTLVNLLNSSLMLYTESLQGALWFLPAWLLASVIFAGTVWLGRVCVRITHVQNCKLPAICLLNLLFGAAGVVLTMKGMQLLYNIQTALTVCPLFLAAWLLHNYLPDFRKYATWYGCIISAFILYQVNERFHIFIDISSLSIPGLWYYPISLLGIYFALCLSNLIEKLKPLRACFAFLGRHSFDIMALHFFVFKLIDWIYGSIIGASYEELPHFPASFRTELQIPHLLIGLFLPAAVGWGVTRASRFCQARMLPGSAVRLSCRSSAQPEGPQNKGSGSAGA